MRKRYLWILLAHLASIVVAVASCSGGMGTGQTGNSSSSGAGTGGSTGTSRPTGVGGAGGIEFSTVTSTGTGMPDSGASDAQCATYLSCQAQGLDCGMASDGCGNTVSCGSCTGTDVCGGTKPNVCGPSNCKPKNCVQLAFDCGMASDGCNGTVNCGSCPMGESCGASMPNTCGEGGVCTPKSCAAQGFNCGSQGDTCGGMLSCGTCMGNLSCGGGGMPGKCGTMCVPTTCAAHSWNCGAVADGCGGLLMCGSCAAGEVCGATMANVCGGMGSTCNGPLVPAVCPNNGTTTITGKVYAPNGTDPLYNVLVYIPNGGPAPTYGVQAFPPNISCDNCGAAATGCPLVQAVTDVTGAFTIKGAPAGANIPLVIQLGRWRRQIVIPSVASCASTAVAATLTRMPRTHLEGDIPLMGFVTGAVDALECVLRKIGIADTEFSDPSGTGRVRFYQGDGAAGAVYSASTPGEDQLWGTQAAIDKYDMVYFACQGSEFDQAQMDQQTVINYANAGGRIFATHFSYVWLDNTGMTNDGWNTTANWAPDPNVSNTFANDPQTGYINTGFPKGMILAQWLQNVGASVTFGQMPISTLRDDFTGVIAPSQLWIHVQDQSLGNVPMHYTFNTPITATPANQCGRVLYDDFHVEDALTEFTQFPYECCPNDFPPGACSVPPMTPQEKMLEFMLFDLASCVTPDVPVCVPQTCAQQNISCGPAGDGCSGVLNCGMCPSGQTCGGGGMASKCGNSCVAKTCAQQGFTCGEQGDTCGNIINCGSCPSGLCGGGGPGKCGNGICTPKDCAQLGMSCGNVGDTCGNIINCGACAAGTTCGGGGTQGVCGSPPCVPTTCMALGFNCGSAANGCGQVLNCGSCPAGDICGGGGKANVCSGAPN